MRVLAYDPGLATGVALFDNENLVMQYTILDGVDGFIAWWSVAAPKADVVVYEDFIAEPSYTGRVWSSEVIGAIKALHSERKVSQLRSMKATLVRGTEAERFQWMRQAGFSGVSHELDAISHALTFLKRSGHKGAYQKYWA